MRSVATYIFCVLVIAALSWFIIYDQRSAVDFVSGNVRPAACEAKEDEPSEIRRGGCVSVGIVLTWHRVDCDLDVTRMMRDGRGWDHKIPSNRASVTPPASDIGKPLGSSRTVAVPPEAFPGVDAHYRATMKLGCGRLRGFNKIVVEIPPLPFEIKAP